MLNNFIKTRFALFLAGAVAALGLGTGLVRAWLEVASHRYLQYGLGHLVLERFQHHLNRWALPALGLFLVLWALGRAAGRQTAQQRPAAPAVLAGACLAALLALNIGALTAFFSNRPAGPSVLLVVVDCLRPDHLGAYGYHRPTSPFMDRLAGEGALFQRAFANAPWTKPSVASLYTSQHPNVHAVVNGYSIMPDRLLTLAELMKNSGYQTAFFNGGNEFIERRYNFQQGFDTCVFRPRETHTAAALIDDFIRFLDLNPSKKFFAYLHTMDAHAPYTRNSWNYAFTDARPEGFEPGNSKGRFKLIRLLTHTGQMPAETREYLAALYDAQIRFTDECLEKAHNALRARGLLGNTLVFITSDHGEEFWDHGNFEHGQSLYNELLQVPLIVSGPGVRPGKHTGAVRLIDIAPTVLEMAGIQAPEAAGIQGQSLVPLLAGKPGEADDRPVFATGVLYGPERYCLILNGRKLIENTSVKSKKWNLIGRQSTKNLELYDLDRDFGEQTDLSGRETLAPLLRELEKYKNQRARFPADELDGAMDPEIRQKLEALGYVQ